MHEGARLRTTEGYNEPYKKMSTFQCHFVAKKRMLFNAVTLHKSYVIRREGKGGQSLAHPLNTYMKEPRFLHWTG